MGILTPVILKKYIGILIFCGKKSVLTPLNRSHILVSTREHKKSIKIHSLDAQPGRTALFSLQVQI